MCHPIVTIDSLKRFLCHKDSKSVLRFKIGPEEAGEKIGQTDRQNYMDFNIPYARH